MPMRTQSFFPLLLALVACALTFCTPPTPTPDRPEYTIDYLQLRKTLKDSSRAFNPAFFKQKHIALVYEIDDSDIVNAPDSVTKIGPMPSEFYPGSFTVIYKDSLDHDLGTYQMWSPFYQRVESPGAGIGIRRVENGKFQVPLPRDPRIGTVILVDGNSQPIVSDVRRFFRKL
jgi:hypothetical protein